MITPPTPSTPRVLIVEDHADIRRLIVLTLEFENFELREASSGQEGWQVAQSFRPDVALLDVMMPGDMDGLALCRQIKSDPALTACRAIMLTARGQAADIQAGRDAGADAYLIKPFNPLHLIETINAVLHRGTSSLSA